MKSKIMKRSVSALLALMVCMVFTLATTVEASAAAKPKTKSMKVLVETTYGEGEYSSKTTYTYDNNGLRTAINNPYSKSTYKHNKKGFVTERRYYEEGNKNPSFITKYSLKKNGDAKKAKTTIYDEETGKKVSTETTKYTYWKKGVIKKSTTTSKNAKYVSTYDKHGNLKSSKSTWKDGKKKYTSSTICKNTVNKKGDLTKRVETYKSSDGEKYVYTTTYKNTYSGGKLVKVVATEKGSDGTFTRTTTYKYKTVNVPKKYQEAVKRQQL